MITEVTSLKYSTMRIIQYLKIACLLALLTGNSACKKIWLEEKSDKSIAVPSRLKDYQAMLNNTLSMNRDVVELGELAVDDHYVTDSRFLNASYNHTRNAYTWTYNLPYIKIQSWGFTYSRIFSSNIVLDGLTRIEPSGMAAQQQWNNIKGQALFFRAESFWGLAQVFAQPYHAATATTDMGIAMRFTIDVADPVVRYSVQETYDQIINDAKEAASLLPDHTEYPSTPSKAAAYGLLARTFLVMENYEEALRYANKCLELKSTLLDYNTLSPASNMGVFNNEVIFHILLRTDEDNNFLRSGCLISPDLYAQYASNDRRKVLFFSASSPYTFRGNYNNNASLFCGIATDEIYLIKAECEARKGQTIEAMNTLNTLLRKRFDNSFVDYTAATAEEALTKILQERRKELLLRNIRWSDLRRLNKDDRFKVTMTRTIAGNTYTIEPNSYKYTFPIPDDIRALNGLPQTPGW